MSKHIVLKTICVSLIGVCCGYGITRMMNNNVELSERHLASIPLTKLGLDQVSYDYIDLKIENVSIAPHKDETSLVQARITARKDIPTALNFKWILGKDVTSSEELTGTLDSMQAGHSKILEIRVQNYSKEWQSHVSLALSGNLAGHHVQREALISSRPEDSFEYVVQQAELNNQKLPSKKAQKLSDGKTVREKFKRANIVR